MLERAFWVFRRNFRRLKTSIKPPIGWGVLLISLAIMLGGSLTMSAYIRGQDSPKNGTASNELATLETDGNDVLNHRHIEMSTGQSSLQDLHTTGPSSDELVSTKAASLNQLDAELANRQRAIHDQNPFFYLLWAKGALACIAGAALLGVIIHKWRRKRPIRIYVITLVGFKCVTITSVVIQLSLLQ